MLRLFLCIFILFCGAVTGLHLSQRLVRRRDILLGFDVMFHRASIQISYNAGDLCEVFSDNFADHEFTHTVPFDIQWARFIDGFGYILSKDDIALLHSFTKGLGTADCEAQRRHISLYCELLAEHIQNAREDVIKKSKTARIIPLAAGIITALMLI